MRVLGFERIFIGQSLFTLALTVVLNLERRQTFPLHYYIYLHRCSARSSTVLGPLTDTNSSALVG
jgi:hypothetical protein